MVFVRAAVDGFGVLLLSINPVWVCRVCRGERSALNRRFRPESGIALRSRRCRWLWRAASLDQPGLGLPGLSSLFVRAAVDGFGVLLLSINPVWVCRVCRDAIGFELDPKFLGFFRAANGLRLIWVTSHMDRHNDPIVHHHSQTELDGTGRINVPSLRELFIDGPGYLFGPDTCGPKQYTDKCLGGWDQHALRTSLRNINDFEQRPDDSSFHLPGLVVSPRYPDPPVLMTSDYAAALGDAPPMLASDYLAFVIATMGWSRFSKQRFNSPGYGGNHDLFVAPPGWLDGAPSPAKLLGLVHDAVPAEEANAIYAQLENIALCAGEPVDGSAYASYNQPPPSAPQAVSSDPNAGMNVSAPQASWADYLGGFQGNLTIPLYDETHYAIKEPVKNVETLRALIGQPVKSANRFMTSVGCLVSVDADGIGTLFTASDGSCGTASFGLDDSDVGRAWYLE